MSELIRFVNGPLDGKTREVAQGAVGVSIPWCFQDGMGQITYMRKIIDGVEVMFTEPVTLPERKAVLVQ